MTFATFAIRQLADSATFAVYSIDFGYYFCLCKIVSCPYLIPDEINNLRMYYSH